MGKAVMSKCVIELLTPEKFGFYWPGIEKQLDTIPHVWELWWTKDFIRDAVECGRFDCWTVGDSSAVRGVVFTQVAIYPANNVLQVLLAFGVGMLDAVEQLDAVISQYAVRRGCGAIEVAGRPGWGPALRGLGFRKVSTVLTKILERERIH